MRRLLVLLGILGLSLGVFLYKADSVVLIEPFVGTKAGNVLLEIQGKAHATNVAVQNKIEETINTFVVKTDERQILSPTKTTQPATSPESDGGTAGEVSKQVTSAYPQQLTAQGTIAQTNQYRRKRGLPELSTNALLTLSAQKKVNDMFAKQYFEHESPSGVGSDDLAHSVGYEYLAIGENLALGDYADDFELVEGWMNSPGHRENILNSHYTEIGVAVKRGLFEGEEVWLAVQEFGRPVSDCPEVDASLGVRIEESQKLLTILQKKLADMLLDIENTKPQYGSVYEEKVDAYNELVHQYNIFVEQSKKDVATYNTQVKVHNACVEK